MTSRQHASTIAIWSIVIAIGVLCLKLSAWRLTGSVALYSDAMESVVNVVTATVAWWAVHVSVKPADGNHNFGHHKAEYLSAVLSGGLIMVAALLILREAILGLTGQHPLEIQASGLVAGSLAALINLAWARQLNKVGKRENSPALMADAKHLNLDVVTTIGVLVSLVLVLLTGWTVLDPIIAIVVALNILNEGWKVVSHSIDGLMDGVVSEEECNRITKEILANASGAIEVHDIRTRRAGAVCFTEFHLVVDAEMSVAKSHVICDRIEDALQASLPNVQVIIHVEPGHMEKPEGLKIDPVD